MSCITSSSTKVTNSVTIFYLFGKFKCFFFIIKKMKSVRIHQISDKFDNLSYDDLEKPKATNTTVLIQTSFAGINYIDNYQRTGLYKPSLPFTLGTDGSGIVEEVGDKVTLFKKGDRVCYFSGGGCYSSYVLLEEVKVLKVPDEISLEVACALMVQGMTGHYLSNDSYQVKKGDTVLIHACVGGTGYILSQLAKIKGAKVIGTVGSEEKIKAAKKNWN